MLTQYTLAIEKFEDELKKASKQLAQQESIRQYHRHRLSDLGEDIVSFSEYFLEAHINATAWMTDNAQEVNTDFSLEKMVRRNKSKAAILEKKALNDLKVTYKGYFFFLRAFQDASYAVLLNIAGQSPGQYSSMKDCLKKKPTPMYDWVNGIDGYENWFQDFKKRRDKVKMGVNFSIKGPQWDVGIGFNNISKEGGLTVGGDEYKISDLIKSINFSSELIKVTYEKSKQDT